MLEFPEYREDRGALIVAQASRQVPFEIASVCWIHGVPPGHRRGGHAHHRLREVVVPVAGSFRVSVDDGATSGAYLLDDPRRGLLLGPMVWRELFDFSRDAVCLVIAADAYDESDYIRDRAAFRALATAPGGR